MLEATDSWAYNIDNGKINGVIFLDLKKTSIKTKLLWFTWQILKYLENRTRRVSVDKLSYVHIGSSQYLSLPLRTGQ